MSDWWSKKLGTNTTTPQSTPYIPQNTPPVVQPAPQTHTPSGNRLPESAMSSSRCPHCGSGNYGKSSPDTRARCYECGYPIQQSGTGTPGVRLPSNGAAEPTKQIDTSNNFNPTTIIGKIE